MEELRYIRNCLDSLDKDVQKLSKTLDNLWTNFLELERKLKEA